MKRALFIMAVILFLSGCFIFYSGFMPPRNASKKLTGEYNKDRLPARYSHLVIMVIDALRADFIFGDEKLADHMPFLKGEITGNRSFSYYSKTNLPTVTMPRLKTLTTGAASDFDDIFFNAASTKLHTDNILHQFQLHGYPIVFYGDNTWLRLFPDTFLRSDGTHSFYVTDYTEVDDNVTRHLDFELSRLDWKVMILHYLGLDHIGHLSGPLSPLIGPKLIEMDQIIKTISSALKRRDANGSRSLLLITGDHGMSDLGSHGGASAPEILTPLIFLDGYGGKYFHGEVVNQVDIASTVATLFSLPVPNENIGHPITSLFSRLSLEEKIQINRQIACQLTLLADDVTNKTLVEYVNSICAGYLRKDCMHITKQISDELSSLNHKYGESTMVFGVIIMFFGFILFYYTFLGLSNSSYQKKYQISTVTCRSSGLRRRMSMVISSLQVVHLTFALISLGSTSFVEEEQYIWYYFTPTFFVMFLLLCRCNIVWFIIFLVLLRIIHAWNRTGVKWTNLEDLSDWFMQSGRENLFYAVVVFLQIVTVLLKFVAENKIGKVLFASCYINVMIYHAISTGVLSSAYERELTFYIPWLVYLHVIIMAILKYSSVIQHSRTVLIPSILLLTKMKDTPWFLMTIILEEIFSKRILQSLLVNIQMADWQIFCLYFSMSKFSYFSQGNSNSLSTVDFAAGMIGLMDYHPFLSNALIFLKTYCGHWFWCCSFLDISQPTSKYMYVNITIFPVIAVLYQSLTAVFLSFIIFIQRYHLFIWSVYAPRYLYMLVTTCIGIALLSFTGKFS